MTEKGEGHKSSDDQLAHYNEAQQGSSEHIVQLNLLGERLVQWDVGQ